jgi:MFS family permease
MIFFKRIFYGWIVVLCSVILLALGVGMYISTNSLFIKPVCESLGFSRGIFSLYRTIVALTGAAVMPLYGKLIQRIGVKKVLVMGALMLGLVAIGYSFSNKLWHFFLLAFVNGLFFNGISFMTVGVLISAWFDGKKGLATGLAYSGSGLGGAIMIPVVGHMIDFAGWQWAYRFMGIIGIAVLMPVIIFFVKNTPTDMSLIPLPADKHGQKDSMSGDFNCSFQEARRTHKFWLLFIAFFFANFFAAAANAHSAPYLSDLGYTTAFITSVLSLYMILLTAGKIVLGTAYDRFGVKTGNLIVLVFCLSFPIFAYLAHMPVIPWIFAVFLGMASCSVTVPAPILVARYFGYKDFPKIFSFIMMAITFAPSVSVPAMGAVYDFTGSYVPAWIAFFFCSIIIAACLICAEILHLRNLKE